MTTLKLIEAFKYLQREGLMPSYLNDEQLEGLAIKAIKLMEKPEWTDSFFPPSTPEK